MELCLLQTLCLSENNKSTKPQMQKARQLFKYNSLHLFAAPRSYYSASIAPPSRDDPKFAWLKSQQGIQNKVGQFVQLPILPCELPKDFSANVVDSYFLTQQRANLLRRVHNDFDILRGDKGLALVGPHGVGKSCFTYLVASYAWVNHFPVCYIVRKQFFKFFFNTTQAKCAEWCANRYQSDLDFDKPAEYWLEQFELLNNDLIQFKFPQLLDILNEKNEKPRHIQIRIMSELKKLDTRVVR